MMDREFEPRFFLRDAHCVVGGAITQRDRTLSRSWFTGKTDATVAVNAQEVADERRYHLGLKTYLWIGRAVFCARIALVYVHPTLSRLRENT